MDVILLTSNNLSPTQHGQAENHGEYIRKDGEGKWKYRLERIKLEAGRCTPERLGFQLRKK